MLFASGEMKESGGDQERCEACELAVEDSRDRSNLTACSVSSGHLYESAFFTMEGKVEPRLTRIRGHGTLSPLNTQVPIT